MDQFATKPLCRPTFDRLGLTPQGRFADGAVVGFDLQSRATDWQWLIAATRFRTFALDQAWGELPALWCYTVPLSEGLVIHIDLPHDAWILVGDGRKALFLRNEGDPVYPNLQTVAVFDQGRVPPTAALGADRPGRTSQHHDRRRASVAQTDWHDLEEHRFAADVAHALGVRFEAGEVSALVVVAPARILADLRQSFSSRLRAKIIAEVDKDLTKHPVHEIERLLFAAGKM